MIAMGTSNSRFLVSGCGLAIAAALVSPQMALARDTKPATSAASASSASDVLPVIIVSARKRSETLQDVPLSVSVITDKEIEKSNLNDLKDVAKFTPGVTLFESVDRGYGQVFIRGMQNTPPVGDTTRELASVFIDGVYYIGGVMGINTNDIQQVEVIKGPQSALYGRSTFSGAINFVTKDPGNDLSGNIRSEAATYNEYKVSGSVDIPIAKDVLTSRISGMYHSAGGEYVNQLNGQRLGAQEDWSMSGEIKFTPTHNITAKLTGIYFEQNDGPAATVLAGRLPTHNFTTPSGVSVYKGVLKWDGVVAQNAFPTNPQDVFGFNMAPFTDFARLGRTTNGLYRGFLFTSLNLKYETDSGYSITYLGGYSRESASRLQDFEFSPENNYFLSRRTNSHSQSNELRIASPSDKRLSWLLGTSYMYQDLYERDPGGIFGGENAYDVYFGDGAILPNQVVILPGPRTDVDLHVVNKAVFGSINLAITDKLNLSLEARYQADELTTPNYPTQTTNSFLPRAIIDYHLTPDIMLYGVISKGIRPTTINTPFILRSAAQQEELRAAYPELIINDTAPPETIWNYEIGAKTTLLGGRMVFNIDGYYDNWLHQQVLQSLLHDFGGGIESTLVTVNGSNIHAYGIEVQTSIDVSPSFNLQGNFAWNKNKLVGPGNDAVIARFLLAAPSGQRLAETPEFSGSVIANLQKKHAFGSTTPFLRMEGIYTGSRYASTMNLTSTGPAFDFNLRAGLQTDRYTLTFFVENLFNNMTFPSLRENADCATDAACSQQAYEAVLPNKRQFGVTLAASF